MPSRFLSPAYEVMLSAASPGINFLRGVAGYQDPIGTPAMQDRMLELEAQKGSSGSIGYEDYGLPVSSEGGRFTGGLPSLLLSNPIDFGLAGSVGRYGYGPEGRTGLKYDFTPDQDTGSTGNAMLDFINKGGLKGAISKMGTAQASEVTPQNEPRDIEDFLGTSTPQNLGFVSTNVAQNPAMVNYGITSLPKFDMANLPMYEKDDEQDQDYIDQVKKSQGGGIGGLLKFLLGLAVPGAGVLMNLGQSGFDKLRGGFNRGLGSLRNLNQRIQGSDFGQARTGAEYFMKRRERKQAERAQKAMPKVYANARDQGSTNERGGFSTSRADRAGTSLGSGQFNSKRSTGRQGY